MGKKVAKRHIQGADVRSGFEPIKKNCREVGFIVSKKILIVWT